MIDLIEMLKKSPDLVIYGAGFEGKKLYTALKKNNIKVKYFAITDGHTKLQDEIDGIPVKFISDIKNIKDDCTVVIATLPKHHFEMTTNLYDEGFRKVYTVSKDWYDVLYNEKSYIFENRSQNTKTMCMVLAGYKEFLWENVFKRLKKFEMEGLDVCILSSGVYDNKLSEICKKNNWSYLSTEVNNVSLIQNLAIKLFLNAEMIFKLDEDIFITENYFKSMLNTYKEAQDKSYGNVGFVAPLIPLNSYSYVRVIEKLGLEDVYRNKFGKIKYCADTDCTALSNPEVAKFFWGEGGFIEKIDNISYKLQQEGINYTMCSTRFNIGAVLFSRKIWEKIGHFSEDISFSGMGMDEKDLCCGSIWNSLVMVVNENILVGHFSFAIQTEEMKKYYFEHQEMFNI